MPSSKEVNLVSDELPVPFEWIDNDRDLDHLLDRLQSQGRIALDTEFHRMKSFTDAQTAFFYSLTAIS